MFMVSLLGFFSETVACIDSIANDSHDSGVTDEDEIAYFTVRWKTRASFVYRTICTNK